MSGFWERKMKTYFTRFDFDRDGVITDKDFELLGTRFADNNHADPEGKEKVIKGFHDVWQKWTLAAKGDGKQNLTIPVFIESIRQQIRDPEEYKKSTGGLIRSMFDVMDVNADGYLQKEEFRGFFEALGVSDLEFVEVAFAAIDLNQDRKLSFEEFIIAYFEFMFTDDVKNPYNLFLGPLVQ